MRQRGVERQAETSSGMPPSKSAPDPSKAPKVMILVARSMCGPMKWREVADRSLKERAIESAPIKAAKIVVTRQWSVAQDDARVRAGALVRSVFASLIRVLGERAPEPIEHQLREIVGCREMTMLPLASVRDSSGNARTGEA